MKVTIIVFALLALTACAQEVEQYQPEVEYYDPNVEYFGIPSFSQIKSGAQNVAGSALRGASNVAGAVSRGANSVSNFAGKVASGTGKVAQVAGTVSKVAKGVQVGAGAVSTGAKFIPHPIARGVSAAAGGISKGAGVVSTVGRQISTGTGTASRVARGVQGVSRGISSAAGAASRGLSGAAGRVSGGRGRVEFEDEFAAYDDQAYFADEFIADDAQEFVDVYYVDDVEDFNLPSRQTIASGLHKAGNVAGTVSNVAKKVSNVAGTASKGLHWAGNKIGGGRAGKELEDEYVIYYVDDVEDFGLPSKQQVANGFKTAGNIAGKVSGPLKTTGAVINRLPPVQVGPVNSRVVGAGLSTAGKAAGIASKGFNYIGNKLGGRLEDEIEYEFIADDDEYVVVYVDDVEDLSLPSGGQIRSGIQSGLRTGANIAGKVSNVAGGVQRVAGGVQRVAGQVSNVAGRVSGVAGGVQNRLNQAAGKFGGRLDDEVVVEDFYYY